MKKNLKYTWMVFTQSFLSPLGNDYSFSAKVTRNKLFTEALSYKWVSQLIYSKCKAKNIYFLLSLLAF